MKLNHLRAVCILIAGAYLVACFWPFTLHLKNNVRWPARGKGLRLARHSIVFSDGELDLGNAGTPGQAGSIGIELWVTPRSETYNEIRSILSLYDGNLPENFMVAEWRSTLLIRTIVRDSRSQRRYREVSVNNALPEGRRRLITIASGPQGTAVYLDGVVVKTYARQLLPPDTMRGVLLLGSSATGKKKWNGELHGLAAFRKTLDATEVLRHYRMWTGPRPLEIETEAGLSALYFFDEGSGNTIADHSGARHPLLIPEYYRVFHKTVLHPPWRDSALEHFNFEDIFANILGFMPFGFFFFLYRARLRPGRNVHSAVVTVAAAATLSLIIELTQAFLPTRDSSLSDWICNTIGGFGGVAVAMVLKSNTLETFGALSQRAFRGFTSKGSGNLKG